jgi:hypothetical protein
MRLTGTNPRNRARIHFRLWLPQTSFSWSGSCCGGQTCRVPLSRIYRQVGRMAGASLHVNAHECDSRDDLAASRTGWDTFKRHVVRSDDAVRQLGEDYHWSQLRPWIGRGSGAGFCKWSSTGRYSAAPGNLPRHHFVEAALSRRRNYPSTNIVTLIGINQVIACNSGDESK